MSSQDNITCVLHEIPWKGREAVTKEQIEKKNTSTAVFFLVKRPNDLTAAETVQARGRIQIHYLLQVFVGPFTNAQLSRMLDFIKIKSVVCDVSKRVTITDIYKRSFTRLHCTSERSYEV